MAITASTTIHTKLGFKEIDYRDYKAELDALKDLKLNKNIIICSGSSSKIKALQNDGYTIKKIIKPHGKLSKCGLKKKNRL